MDLIEGAQYASFGSSSRSLSDSESNAAVYHFKEPSETYVQSRSDRIRAAMFPELANDERGGTHIPKTRSTIVEQLSEPSQLVKTALLELLSLQDEIELATKAIPELIKLLSDRDEVVVLRAAQMVHRLSRADRSVRTIAKDPSLISALFSASRCKNEDIQTNAIATLAHISEHAEGRMHLFRSGGIPELVRMLSVPISAVRHYAITTLHNLLLYMESAKQETRGCGGIEAMTPLLRERNPKFLALLADSLYLLLLDHPQSKLVFLSLNGPSMLVDLLNTHRSYAKLVYAVVRCIRAVSVCRQSKISLIALGALQVLEGVIEGADERTQIAILSAVRNLSDAAANEENLGPLVVRMINIVAVGDETSVSCATGILSNLTCNNVRNKQTLCANRGVDVLCSSLERFASSEEVTEPALCALRHCTARHSMAPQAQSDVRLSETQHVILDLLSSMRAPVVKAALGLVRNLALLPSNLHALAHETTAKGESAVSLAMDVLARAGDQFRQDPEALVDGVAMRELVEGAVSALHQLANDPYVAEIVLRDHLCVDMLIKLLSWEEVYANEDELLQRELLGLLYQLTKTPAGARQIEVYGPRAALNEALHSQHRSIATYASGVLKNLQFDKPMMYGELEPERGITDGEEEWMQMHDGMEPELFAEMYQSPGVDRLEQQAPWQPPPYQTNNPNQPWFDTDL